MLFVWGSHGEIMNNNSFFNFYLIKMKKKKNKKIQKTKLSD